MLFKLTSRMVVTSPREVLFGPEQSCKTTSGGPLISVFGFVYLCGFSVALTRQSTCTVVATCVVVAVLIGFQWI